MNDDDLPTRWHGAVADAGSRRTPERIRSRTDPPDGRAGRLLAMGGAAVATAVTIAAVSMLGAHRPAPGQAPGGGSVSTVGGTLSSTDGSITVVFPTPGATVRSPFVVQGRAATFDGNVQWELRDGNAVVARGFTSTGACCRPTPYAFTVPAAPGHFTLVVHDEDVSGGEGPAPARVTEHLTVR